MATSVTKPKEIKESMTTKDVYYFVDKLKNIKIKSREVYKKSGKEIHYPFWKNGERKYKNSTGGFVSFIYEDGHVPAGCSGSWYKGYGFTKDVSPLLYYLLTKNSKITTIKISKKEKTSLRGSTFIFNIEDLDKVRKRISALLKRQKEDKELVVNNILAGMFPKNYKRKASQYRPGSLYEFIDKNNLIASLLSDEDFQGLSDLLADLSPEHSFVKKHKLLATKQDVDKVYIEDLINGYKALLDYKNDTRNLEERWQSFFKEYSCIFSQLFTHPMVLFGDKMYVGGKNISNKDGKIADFIYQNDFSKNVAIIEIKTHRTSLVEKKPYRGGDVFPITKEMSGAINQVLDQKDNLQKAYKSLLGDNKYFKSFNPQCIVLIGSIRELKKEQVKSFELFRNNHQGIDVVTFDELYYRISNILDIFKQK